MTVFKMYTLSEVHGMLPKGTLKIGEFEKMVEEAGTFHKFGRSRVMDERDILDFLERCSARRGAPKPPHDDEAGQMVFIGSPSGNTTEHAVWIGWCPIGHELDTLDRVRVGAQDHVMILATENMTYGDVDKWRKDNTARRTIGSWYKRDRTVVELMDTINIRAMGELD